MFLLLPPLRLSKSHGIGGKKYWVVEKMDAEKF